MKAPDAAALANGANYAVFVFCLAVTFVLLLLRHPVAVPRAVKRKTAARLMRRLSLFED